MNEYADPDGVRSGRWALKLLVATVGLLLFLLVSGLAMYLSPSPSNFTESQSWGWKLVQWLIIGHVVFGVVVVLIFARYQWQHYFRVRPASVDFGKLLGYVSFWLFVISAVTGLVLTWQGLFGPKISYWLDTVHIWSSLALAPILGLHLARIWIKVRKKVGREILPLLRTSQLRLIAGSLAITVVLVGIGFGFAFGVQATDISGGVPPQTYSLKYGDDPFLPSNVQTSTGGAINADLLAGSAGCGDCHVDIYEEWQASAHRWSASDVFYTTVTGIMQEETGIESTRYCAGCHNPISTLSGNLTTEVADSLALEGKTGQEALHYEEGISCSTCHGVTQILGTKGNGNYLLTPSPRYLFELEEDSPLLELISDFLIRSFPRTHKETLSRAHYKIPEFCGTCHKQYLDESINNFGWVRLQNQYDNWKESKWNNGPDDPTTIVCIECHMPLLPNEKEVSSGVSDGDPYGPHPDQHRSHRWLGANQAIPWLLEETEQVRLTEQWLKGEYPVPEIEHKWEDGPVIGTTVTAPGSVTPGGTLEYDIVISNRKVGHEFPTGPLDLIQTWIETRVEDAAGNVILHRGFIDENNYVDPEAHYFRSFPIDEDGNVIYRHNLWDMVGTTYVRVIFPGFSERVSYEIDVPEDAVGPISVTATLRMRKFHQKIVDAATENSGLTFPITDLSSSTVSVDLAPSKVLKTQE